MRTNAACLVLIFLASLSGTAADAASGGFQSGSSSNSGASGTPSGARSSPANPPRGNFSRPGFPGAAPGFRGLGGRGFVGPGSAGRGSGGVGFAGQGLAGRGPGGRDFLREPNRGIRGRRDFGRDYDRFGNRGFGGGVVVGVPAFIPGPDLLGLPYYDGFEYPYAYPGAGVPYNSPEYYPPAPDAVPDGVYPPPALVPQSTDQQPAQPVWYYCQDPMGYYPYVRDCNSPWQAVPASVLPPPQPDGP